MGLHVLILIVTSDALTELGAFAASIMALTVFLQTPALFAPAAFHARIDFLHLFSISSVNVLLFSVFASLTTANLGITDLTCSVAVTVIFLASRVFAVAALSIGVDRLKDKLFFKLRFLDFHVANGKRKFFLHRFW